MYYIVVDTNVLKPKSNYFVQSVIPIFIISSYGYYQLVRFITGRIPAVKGIMLYAFVLVSIVLPAVPDLFLFLHAGKANGPRLTRNEGLVERNFEQMAVIHARNGSLTLRETTLLYIDALLDIFPDNSSKVDLYLAKARLICPDAREEAVKYIEMANGFLCGESVDYRCQ